VRGADRFAVGIEVTATVDVSQGPLPNPRRASCIACCSRNAAQG